ncbi:MAG TPA: quinoprotein dehydrogenase-associated putative ABC transporter substrate-binding protein [Luteitalea sp.]|nr:quinoprotein dehydrogenase-associated putative ABC transporter substrate-binding protein [Luteitalea sp.]
MTRWRWSTRLRWSNGIALALSASLVASVASASRPDTLRVCADPNNLPFSNARGQGFENVLATMLAEHLDARLEYTWWAHRRGFLRHTLAAGACDVVMGVPPGLPLVDTTRPYYQSRYVFVTQRARRLHLRSIDDARLSRLRVGVQMVGDDFANSPPAHALSTRGVITNVRGFSVLGDYAQPNPPARIVDAVAQGTIDVALVWGPLAGYFAARQPVPLDLRLVAADADTPDRPLTFAIAMAVRRHETARRQQLEGFLTRRRAAIDRVLDSYGVPRVDRPHGGRW